MSPTHIVSTAALVLIFVGLFSLKRSIKVHAGCMASAFVLDLGLVLYIEISRKAVESVAASMSPLLWFHVIISTLALILYVVQLVLGWRLYTGKPVSKTAHRWCGIVFLVLRLGNYVTSFMV